MQNNDIVQGSFNENYRNLIYKHIMALKWVIQLNQCLDVKVVVKLDSPETDSENLDLSAPLE